MNIAEEEEEEKEEKLRKIQRHMVREIMGGVKTEEGDSRTTK